MLEEGSRIERCSYCGAYATQCGLRRQVQHHLTISQDATEVATYATELVKNKEDFFNDRIREKENQISILQSIVDEFASSQVGLRIAQH